jgi:hypothetical protein
MGDGSSSSFSSDDLILEQLFVDMDSQRQCAFACVVVVANSFHMFNANMPMSWRRVEVNQWT